MDFTPSGSSLIGSLIRLGKLGLPPLALAAGFLVGFAAVARAAAPLLPTGQAYTVRNAKIEMVWIPPGQFTMGSPETEQNRSPDEGPQTKVTISRGFWLGRSEITQAQWKAVMGTSINELFAQFYAEKQATPNRTLTFPKEGPGNPMPCMTWEEAMEFCRKLAQQEREAGRLPEGWEYTLPTEAQWEYACRAGTSGAWAGDLDVMAWYGKNSGGTTQPVRQKKPNAWGLYDMYGNVWEWCRDWYGDQLPGGAVTDPVGATSGTLRVYRGGSRRSSADTCRSAVRGGAAPDNRDDGVGFRLALVPSPAK